MKHALLSACILVAIAVPALAQSSGGTMTYFGPMGGGFGSPTLGRCYVRGIAEGDLIVRWPPSPSADRSNTPSWTDNGANALLIAALLQPDALANVIMTEIDREANALMPIRERTARIAELEHDIDELQRVASDLAYAGRRSLG
jgi:hypothetical protein